ncbi:hypothetical protein H0X10_02940 [Candidatus Saccharibacteria bacterium]|nr:hypothetical protein [Candidatus Saccharibacteria bacterium]
MRKNRQKGLSLVLAMLLAYIPAGVFAQSSSSTNYRVDQTIFGTGGELDAVSGTYRARQTAGELTIGNTASLNYQAYAGFNTTDEPFIEFVVTAANIDLGYLNPSSVSTASGSFYVRAWQASGYVVRTESDPPANVSNPAQTIAPLGSPTASSPGTEQFGINLKDNSAPDVGAELQQVPDATFSFGQVESGYDTINQFKYNKGDVIARSVKSTSVTIYTMSYIFNISDTTESGQYTFNHILVATGTY